MARRSAPPEARAYDAVLAAPFGRLGVITRDGFLERLEFVDATQPLRAPASRVAAALVEQMQAYVHDPRFRFSLPLRMQGTVFQRRVWAALQEIPSGQTRSYGDLGAALGSGARAVGGACRANPIPIIVPCHRVLAAAGLGGFAGHTTGPAVACKRWLLDHEAGAGAHLKPGASIPT